MRLPKSHFEVDRALCIGLIVTSWCVGCMHCSCVFAYSFDDVRSAVGDYERAVNLVSLNAKFEILQCPRERPDLRLTLHSDEHCIVDSSGRARCEVRGQRFRIPASGAALINDQQFVGTFAEGECRSAEGTDRLTSGRITNQRSDLGWTIDPREMTTHYFRKPVSVIITEAKGMLVGKDKHDGAEVLVIETEIHKTSEEWRYRFWIDPSKNFAVVKRAALIRILPDTPWIEYARIIGFNYKEVQPGIWLPGRVVQESFDPSKEQVVQGKEPPLSWRFTSKELSWLVNPQVSTETFRLEFPSGIVVEDHINDRAYVVGHVADAALDEQADVARNWLSSESRGWSLKLNVLLVVVLIGVVFWRYQKKKCDGMAR